MARALKVGVVLKIPDQPAALPQLIEWNQEQPLMNIIMSLCSSWNLKAPEDYVLKIEKDSELLTDENKNKLQTGNVLHLTYKTWTKYAQLLKERLQNPNTSETSAKLLADLVAQDQAFAKEFVVLGGFEAFLKKTENEKSDSPVLTYCLRAFLVIIDLELYSWTNVPSKFIQNVASLLSQQSPTQSADQLKAALEIVEAAIVNRDDCLAQVEPHIPLDKLVQHVKNADVDVVRNVLVLISTLLSKVDRVKRKKLVAELYTRSIRSNIMSYVIQNSNTKESMAHELHVLQRNCLNVLEERCKTPIEVNDSVCKNWLNDLRKTLLEMGVDASSQKSSDDALIYKRLGFENVNSPLSDFSVIPPGALAMDNIVYFGRMHPEDQNKVVLENSFRANEYDLPFIKACIELTRLLYNILEIGKKPTDSGTTYHPMLFNCEDPFGELFSCCILFLNKTWKEMSAALVDFNKVFEVMKEQVTRSLQSMPTTADQLKTNLSNLPYQRIAEIWQAERQKKEAWESQAKPIQELRKKLEPEMLDLIKQQRLNFLMNGSHFPLPKTRTNAKHMFCRLTANNKTLCYGDCDDTTDHSHENLTNKLPVSEIKGLYTGTDCPHAKDKKVKGLPHLMFSIIQEGVEDTVNFTASSEDDFCMWTDGLNALIGSPMTSKLRNEHLEMLLNMEVKLRLLDTEGIEIPKDQPEIPPDPPNYDFAYDI